MSEGSRERWLSVLRSDLEHYWSVRGVVDVEGLVSEAIVSRVLPLLSGGGFVDEQHFRNTCRQLCQYHILSLLRRVSYRVPSESLCDSVVVSSSGDLLVRDALLCWVNELCIFMESVLRYKLGVLGLVDDLSIPEVDGALFRRVVRRIDRRSLESDGEQA